MGGYLAAVRAVFSHGRASGRIEQDPSVGVVAPKLSRKEKQKQSKPRFPFSTAYLNAFFASAWYQRGVNQWGRRSASLSGAARYWVPVIALFHGLRLEEICQMSLRDVGYQSAVLALNVSEEEDDQGLKNEASKRWIPVHQTLMNLGFEQYVREQREQQGVACAPDTFTADWHAGQDNAFAGRTGRLFPELTPVADNRFSNAFGKMFARFVRQEMKLPKGFVFHSMRHSFKDALREAKGKISAGGVAWPRGMASAIAGRALSEREKEEGSAAQYGRGFRPSAMQPFVNLVAYEGVVLPLPWSKWETS
jgi:integrase